MGNQDFLPDIRIISMNKDKTRRVDGSDMNYHVYFELSDVPAPEWISILKTRWNALNSGQSQPLSDVTIDNKFLAVACPLQDVASVYVPALQKAMSVVNAEYQRCARNEAADLKQRIDSWAAERKAVSDTADSLRFD